MGSWTSLFLLKFVLFHNWFRKGLWCVTMYFSSIYFEINDYRCCEVTCNILCKPSLRCVISVIANEAWIFCSRELSFFKHLCSWLRLPIDEAADGTSLLPSFRFSFLRPPIFFFWSAFSFFYFFFMKTSYQVFGACRQEFEAPGFWFFCEYLNSTKKEISSLP